MVSTDRLTLEKMFLYADTCKTEISGFGSVKIGNHRSIGRGSAHIQALFPLLKQTCNGTETEAIESSIQSLIESSLSKHARLWWHSHVWMECFWSADDKAVIESLGRTVPFLVSVVVNKKGLYKCRFDYFKPFRCTVDDIKLEIFDDDVEAMRAKVEAEVNRCVKPRVYKMPPAQQNYKYQPPVSQGQDFLFPFDGDGYSFGEHYNAEEETRKKLLALAAAERGVVLKNEPKQEVQMGVIDKRITLSVEQMLLDKGLTFDAVAGKWINKNSNTINLEKKR